MPALDRWARQWIKSQGNEVFALGDGGGKTACILVGDLEHGMVVRHLDGAEHKAVLDLLIARGRVFNGAVPSEFSPI